MIENTVMPYRTYVHAKSYPPSFSHKLRKQHGGMKPPELCEMLIKKYSENTGLILDPFVGVGGTLIGAWLAERKAIGIDINSKWKAIYHQVCDENNVAKYAFHVGDSKNILKSQKIKKNSIDLILTDVPYWAMDKLEKTRGKFSKAGEESKEKLPSSLKKFNDNTIQSFDEWLALISEVFKLSRPKLKDSGKMIVFIGNMYRNISETVDNKVIKQGKYLNLSNMLTKEISEIGYKFINEIIWYSPDRKLGIYGYPYTYIPSIVDQRILIFDK